jgi:hypothetical protein
MVARDRAAYTPAACNGGVGGTKTTHALLHIDEWLAGFPGHFVTLNYGSNHAGGCDGSCLAAFDSDMRTLIGRILAAGKVPVIPTIPWSRDPALAADLPALNARIAQLYIDYSQVVRGPDLFAFFQANQSLISSDDLHPTTEGFFRLKKLWADTMAGPNGPYGP